MPKTIRIKKGLDIPLFGKADSNIISVAAAEIGLVPDDFPGHIWKCDVKAGDKVTTGTLLLHDKETTQLKITSPVAGTIKEIRRGERRKIEAVVITPESNTLPIPEYDLEMTPESIRATLKSSGLWVQMRQRPYDIVPAPDSEPRDIFITAFDSAPLAPVLLNTDDRSIIEKGLEVLKTIIAKKPVIGLPADSNISFDNAENYKFEGPHPAGNVGVQIAAIQPVNKGETVWTLNVNTVKRIGSLYLSGKTDWNTLVAITGPEVKTPHYVRTEIGCDINSILKNDLKKPESELRIISGNVLTGVRVEKSSGFLRYPYYQITVIEEGNHADEFMGWASMNPNKFSIKKTFPAFLKGLKKPFPFDARIKGGHRAMILSGEYDKVFPFDIYPEYLIKAIMAGDIDRMEKLGIYEVAPEDFALPEFADTSKIELQKLVREGLDKLREEA